MRVLPVLGVALLLALLAYGLTTTGSNGTINSLLAQGRSAPAPSFDLPVLHRGKLPLRLKKTVGDALADARLGSAELRGTPVMLNFWASWCSPCQKEIPRLESGWRHYGPRGILFLGINIQDLSGDARRFLRGVTYPSVGEQQNELARRYGATGTPETYFLDRKGRVVGHVIGIVSRTQLDEGIAAAVSGRVAGSKQGGARRPQR